MLAGKKKRTIVIAILLSFFAMSLKAQKLPESLVKAFDLYSSFEFQSPLQWDSIRGQLLDIREESVRYQEQLEQGPKKYMIYPFWLGNEYKQLAECAVLRNIKRIGYLGYILDPKTGYETITDSWWKENILDDPAFKDIPADLILFCRGRSQTERFLRSDTAQLRCIQFVLDKLNRKKDHLRKPDGLNIYFPDFSFQFIDQFKRFIYKVSRYNLLFGELESKRNKLFVTLPKAYRGISQKLSGLLPVVDGFYYADFDRFGLDTTGIVIRSDSLVDSLTFEEAYVRYRPFHFRTPLMWDLISNQFVNDESMRANYGFLMNSRNHKYVIYPYWLGHAYQKVSLKSVENIERIGYMGYVLDPLTGYPDLTNSWEDSNILDDAVFRDIPADLLLFCQGREVTNIFLESDSSRLHCIQTLFKNLNRSRYGESINGGDRLRNPDGINIFFPDYSFVKKRELVQFVKSISLVNDSLKSNRTKKNHKYQLYLTFPKKDKKETPFLSCLLQYADSIYFANYNQFGIDTVGVDIFSKATDTTMIFQKIYNQFLMYRFALGKASSNNDKTSVSSIIEGGNSDNTWEYYLFVILFLILVLLFSPLGYCLNCRFQFLVRKNIVGVIVAGLMILFEIMILMLFMIEEMSIEHIFFDTEGSYFLLFLPIIVAGISPAIKILQKRVVVP